VTESRWFHVWENEADAQQFATSLRRRSTVDSNWRVFSVPNNKLSNGPLGPLEIYVIRRSDGYSYSLTPISGKLIATRYPEANIIPNMLIAARNTLDFENTQGPIWEHVARILTGLSRPQIKQLGGYRIIDWDSKRAVCGALRLRNKAMSCRA
jgi:hypothetical protein